MKKFTCECGRAFKTAEEFVNHFEGQQKGKYICPPADKKAA